MDDGLFRGRRLTTTTTMTAAAAATYAGVGDGEGSKQEDKEEELMEFEQVRLENGRRLVQQIPLGSVCELVR